MAESAAQLRCLVKEFGRLGEKREFRLLMKKKAYGGEKGRGCTSGGR